MFALPRNEREVQALLQFARDKDLRVLVLGGGTNLLVADSPLDALVLSTEALRGTETLQEDSEEVLLRVAGGHSLKSFLSWCLRRGLSGLEALAGIPGTVGGAVKGNAGAFGVEVSQCLRKVCLLDAGEGLRHLQAQAVGFGYRRSGISDEQVVLCAEFSLKRMPQRELKERFLRYFSQKERTQPLGERSAGCVFKNPPGASAGELLEAVGLKGYRIGDIQVSPRHANFFINLGKGRAEDFLRLIEEAKQRVLKSFALELQLEIRLWS